MAELTEREASEGRVAASLIRAVSEGSGRVAMQALSLADTSVADELQCAICFDLMTSPVSLKCQHSFCTSCIQRTAAQNGSVHCPLCRKRSHSVESLTENKMLRVMCDLAKEARDAQCPKHAGHVMEYAAEGSNPRPQRACDSHACALR